MSNELELLRAKVHTLEKHLAEFRVMDLSIGSIANYDMNRLKADKKVTVHEVNTARGWNNAMDLVRTNREAASRWLKGLSDYDAEHVRHLMARCVHFQLEVSGNEVTMWLDLHSKVNGRAGVPRLSISELPAIVETYTHEGLEGLVKWAEGTTEQNYASS